MNRQDQLNGTDVRTGTPISRGPSAGSATEPDNEVTNRPFVDSIHRSTVNRVTP